MTFATRQVGQTNLTVTTVSLGGSSIGNMGKEISDADAAAVLDHAWAQGIRYFDTAPHYGRGRSETRFGAWLADKPRDQYVLSSKVGRVLSPGAQLQEADGFINPLPNAVRYDYSADGILESFEGSCAATPKPGVWFNYEPAPDHIIEAATRLQARAAAVGLTLAAAAVQFAMRHPIACSVLIGTGKINSLQRNLDAASLDLSEDALAFVTT